MARRFDFDPLRDAVARFLRRGGGGASDRQRRNGSKVDEDVTAIRDRDRELGSSPVCLPDPSFERTASARSASMDRGIVGRLDWPLWSQGKRSSIAENVLDHANRHGADVGSVNALNYMARSQQFLRDPPSTALIGRRTSGATVVYDPKSDLFGVMAADGTPQTVYRPDPSLHPHGTNLEYFYANVQEVLS